MTIVAQDQSINSILVKVECSFQTVCIDVFYFNRYVY